MAAAPVLLDRHGRPIPQGEFRRARAQAAMGAFLAGSGSAPELRDWTPAAGSADADLDGDRQTIAVRARDLERNDALVSGAVQSLKDSAIGFGLDFQSMPDYRALGIDRDRAQDAARRIEAIWHEWSEDRDACDVTGQLPFGAMLRQSVQSDLVNGESLQLALWLPERQRRLGSRFATVMQSVEAEAGDRDRLFDLVNFLDADRPAVWLPDTASPFDCFRYGGLFQVIEDFSHKYLNDLHSAATISLGEVTT